MSEPTKPIETKADAPWVLDIRVGCVAVYEGEPRECLDTNEPCIFFRMGFHDGLDWQVRKEDVELARLIYASRAMLESLSQVLQLFTEYGHINPWYVGQGHARSVLENVKQSVADATGKAMQ
jgi:hypothetical protein